MKHIKKQYERILRLNRLKKWLDRRLSKERERLRELFSPHYWELDNTCCELEAQTGIPFRYMCHCVHPMPDDFQSELFYMRPCHPPRVRSDLGMIKNCQRQNCKTKLQAYINKWPVRE